MRTPTNTAIGIVNASTGAREQRNKRATVPRPPEWRTTRSIKRTNCGTKKTKVKTARPRIECEATSRPIYLSSRRIFARGHTSMLTEWSAEARSYFESRDEFIAVLTQTEGPLLESR